MDEDEFTNAHENMGSKLVLPELSYRIVGCCFDVHNMLGGGRSEAVYQRGLAIQFAKQGISFEEQLRVPVLCDGQEVGADIADFVVDRSVVVEVKAGSRSRVQDFYQTKRYVLALGLRLGILARFHLEGVQISRVLSPKNLEP